jgi:hypothetical protein
LQRWIEAGHLTQHEAVTKKARNHVDDLLGASRLAINATRSVTDPVDAMHRTIGGGPALLSRPLDGATRLLTGPSTRASAASPSWSAPASTSCRAEREGMLAVLNGVLDEAIDAVHSRSKVATFRSEVLLAVLHARWRRAPPFRSAT